MINQMEDPITPMAIGQINYLLKGKIIENLGTTANLCRHLGWSEYRMGRIINGRQQATAEEKAVLCKVLGSTEEELFPRR
jgi:plasmid maintenance system antidote protein VapI